jgi:outer membrane protein assembly factor BamB
MTRSSIAACLAVLALAPLSADDQWPQFRGRTSGVAADNPRLPDTWSPTTNVVWRADVPGIGWSSPVVWDDLIVLTSVIPTGSIELPEKGFYGGGGGSFVAKGEHRWMVYGLDFKTGRVRWERELRRAQPTAMRHAKNTYASETPIIDGERIYVYFGGLGLFALDMQGKELWNNPMDPVTMRAWGTGASPAVHGGRVYLVNDNDDRSSLTAYDAKSGKVVWTIPRDETSNWSTPYIWEHDGVTEIITTGSRQVRSYDLNGQLKWHLKGMTSLHVPTPVSGPDMLFISSGFLGDAFRPVYAIRPGASGDISLKGEEKSNEFVAWSNPRLGTYITSPLLYGGHYYTLMDRGFLLCHDARTGEEVYPRQRITAEASGFTSSPWAYNGKVFALSEDGDTFVMQAGREFKLLGKNSLGEMAMATPAIVQDSLLLRTASKLYRISNR